MKSCSMTSACPDLVFVSEKEESSDAYKYKHSISVVVQKLIELVYDRLSDSDLLEHCVEGYLQNNNESRNAVTWRANKSMREPYLYHGWLCTKYFATF